MTKSSPLIDSRNTHLRVVNTSLSVQCTLVALMYNHSEYLEKIPGKSSFGMLHLIIIECIDNVKGQLPPGEHFIILATLTAEGGAGYASSIYKVTGITYILRNGNYVHRFKQPMSTLTHPSTKIVLHSKLLISTHILRGECHA